MQNLDGLEIYNWKPQYARLENRTELFPEIIADVQNSSIIILAQTSLHLQKQKWGLSNDLAVKTFSNFNFLLNK